MLIFSVAVSLNLIDASAMGQYMNINSFVIDASG